MSYKEIFSKFDIFKFNLVLNQKADICKDFLLIFRQTVDNYLVKKNRDLESHLENMNSIYSVQTNSDDYAKAISTFQTLKNSLQKQVELFDLLDFGSEEKKINKLATNTDTIILNVIDLFCTRIYNRFAMDFPQKNELNYQRLQFSGGKPIAINSYSITEQFDNEIRKVMKTLKQFANKMPANASKLLTFQKETNIGKEIFLRLKQCVEDYNNLQQGLDSLVFEELSATDEYKIFVSNLKRQLHAKNEIRFDSQSEFETFVVNSESSMKLIQSISSNIAKDLKLVKNVLDACLMKNFFIYPQHWKEQLERFYNISSLRIKEVYLSKFTEAVINHINSFFDHSKGKNLKISIDYKIENFELMPVYSNDQLFSNHWKSISSGITLIDENFQTFGVSRYEKIKQKYTVMLNEFKQLCFSELSALNDKLKSKSFFIQDIISCIVSTEFKYAQDNQAICYSSKFNENQKHQISGLLENINSEVLKQHIYKLKEANEKTKYHQSTLVIDNFEINMKEVFKWIAESIDQNVKAIIDQLQKRISNIWYKVLYFCKSTKNTLYQLLPEVNENLNNYSEQIMRYSLLSDTVETYDTVIKLINEDEEFLLLNVTDYEKIDEQTEKSWYDFKNLFEERKNIIDAYKEDIYRQIETNYKTVEPIVTKIIEDQRKFKNQNRHSNQNAFDVIKILENSYKTYQEFIKSNGELIKSINLFPTLFASYIDNFQIIENFFVTDIGDWKVWIEMTKVIDDFLMQKWMKARSELKQFHISIRKHQDLDSENKILISSIQSKLKEVDIWIEFLEKVAGFDFDSRNWSELLKKLEIPQDVSELTGWHFLNNKNFFLNKDFLEALQVKALNEKLILRSIDEISFFLKVTDFEFKEFTRTNQDLQVNVICNFDKIIEELDEKSTILYSLKASPFCEPFSDRIINLEDQLHNIELILSDFKILQAKWLQLIPIMNGSLMKQNRKGDMARFYTFNSQFVSHLKFIHERKSLTTLLEINDLKNSFAKILENFESVQKNLIEYLERKRYDFPRFYFLGDNDLILLLGDQRPETLNKIIKNLFQGIKHFMFSDNCQSIKGVYSDLEEPFELAKEIQISSDCVKLFQDLELSLQLSFKKSLESFLLSFSFLIKKFPKSFEQECVLSNWIYFYENFKKEKTLNEMEQIVDQNINFLLSQNFNDSMKNNLKDALILNCITQRDIITKFRNLEGQNTFYYFSLLKYEYFPKTKDYMNQKNETLLVNIGHLVTHYSFEFLGNQPRLVYTPLTEKCFLTFSEAMVLGLGGNPYGPAGTGKTETVKALGGMLGRLVVVFNCDENMEFKNISRLFIGIAGCGAWGCFDEFNRLALKELSAVSQIISEIQSQLKLSKINNTTVVSECLLLSKQIKFSSSTGIFVTLNPASKGYRGRSRLPENLKILFRSFAMTRPNLEIIAKVTFVCSGYNLDFAESASKKIVALFQCALRILGNDISYDWGLRALKTTILQAALFKKTYTEMINNKPTSDENLTQNQMNKINSSIQIDNSKSQEVIKYVEFLSLNTAVEINIIPKLKEKDKDIFKKIYDSVFKEFQLQVNTGSVKFEFLDNEVFFKRECESAFKSKNLLPLDSLIDNLYKMTILLNQRVGFAIIGPSGSGKSTLIKTLKFILTKFNKKVQIYKIFPKAIDKNLLFGSYDQNGIDFTEGTFVKILRNAINDLKNGEYSNVWIVFDGDIDPVWVETLNSALDDNRLFTLPTGERFLFPQGLNIIFETVKLKTVSMATVSRIGLVNNSISIFELNKINEFLSDSKFSHKSENQSEIKEYMRLMDKFSLNKNFGIHNVADKKHKILIKTKDNETMSKQVSFAYFFCNKMTGLKEFGSFLTQISRRTNESAHSISGQEIVCVLNDFDLIKEDEFGTVALDQILIQIIDEGTYYYENHLYTLANLKVHIRLSSRIAFFKLSKRLRNRLFLEVLPENETKFKEQEKKSLLRNSNLKELSAFVVNKDLEEDNIKDIEHSKLKYLLTPNVKETNSKYLTFSTKLPKNFFAKGKQEFEFKYRCLREKNIELWNACDIYKNRFEKLYLALTNKNIGDILFAGEDMVDRKTCIEFTASYIGIDVYRISNTNFIARDICNIIQEIFNGKTILLLLEEHQVLDEYFMSKIDSLSNFDNFMPFTDEAKAFFGQKDNEFTAKLISARKKFRICIIWSKSSAYNFEELLNGFSCFQRKFTVIMDDHWMHKDTNQYVTTCFNFENINIHTQIIETLEKQSQKSKVKPFIRIFGLIMQNKKLEYMSQTEKYEKGISSFMQAQSEIQKMKVKVEEEKVKLKDNQEILNKKVEEITRSTFQVNDKRAIALSLEQELKDEQINLKTKKRQIEDELNKVMPMVEDAKQQIKSLSMSNIDELRSYKIPPEPAIDILTALLKLMNEFDTSWSNIKKVLSKRTIIEQIIEIDPRIVKPAVVSEIEQLITKKKDSFDKDKVIKISVAAAPIAEFVKAILKFVKTVQNIQPLEDEFRLLDEKLKGSLIKLKETENNIEALVKRQTSLQESLKQTSMETEELKLVIKDKESFFLRACSLLESLDFENQRWKNNLASFEEKNSKLESYCFAASYYCTFLSSEESKIAKSLFNKFTKSILNINDFSPLDFIVNTKELMSWTGIGHPDSEHELLNTAFLKTILWPSIIVDPEEKILDFIQKSYENVEVIDQNDPKVVFKLELAVKFGKTLLITNSNFPIPQYLAEVHMGRTMCIDKNSFLKFNDKIVQKHPNFTIYLFTKARSLSNKLKAKYQVFNYSSSIESIQEDILSRLVDWKNPDIELSKKSKLLAKHNLKKEIFGLEEKMLDILSSSDSNFVENESLFVTLTETRVKANETKRNIAELENFLAIVAEHRNIFKPVSIKISLTFDIIFSLTKLSGMYFYSSKTLFERLSKFMGKYDSEFVAENFLKSFIDELCNEIYQSVSNCHYLAFMTQMAFQLGLFDSPSEQPRFFSNILKLPNPKTAFYDVNFLDVSKSNKKATKIQIKNKLIPENLGYVLQKLQIIYPTMINDLLLVQNKKQIEDLLQSRSDLEQIFLSRFFLPEKLPIYMIQYLSTKFGKESVVKEKNIANFLRDDKFKRILIFFNGHKDPSAEIQSFCEKAKIELYSVSFGKLKTEEFVTLFNTYCSKPVCLYLKDLHLNVLCAGIISDTLDSPNDKVHKDFKIILSSEPLENLPHNLLEKFERLFLESESSIIRSFKHAEELLKNSSHQNRTLSNLAMFHAIVVERLNYLPFGWSKDYQFNSFDLLCAFEILKLMSSNSSEQMITNTLCNIIYLAKIEDTHDKLILKFLFDKIFDPNFDLAFCMQSNNDEKLLSVLLGLEYSALISSKTQYSNSIRSSIKLLNWSAASVNFEDISENNNQTLRKIVDTYAELEEIILFKSAKDSGSNLLDYFILSEIENYEKLIKDLQNIIDPIKKYLSGRIKLYEVSHYIDLIKLETPQPLQDLWEYCTNILDYMKRLPLLKSNLQNNLMSIRSKNFSFDFSGFLDHSKFFEIMKLNFLNNSKENKMDIYQVGFKMGAVNSAHFKLNGLFLQGADLDKNYRLARLSDTNKYNPFITLEIVPIEICDCSEINKNNRFIEIPLYLNSARTTKLLNLWIEVDPNLYKTMVIASIGLFIHNF